MKLIGKLREKINRGYGNNYIDWLATIEQTPHGVFDVSLKEVYEDGSYGNDILNNTWAASIGAAKRRIIQDTGWKSSDFTWEEVES